MYRLGYRNFGDHESIVANHTVNVGDAAKHAGIRWYEVRSPNGTPRVPAGDVRPRRRAPVDGQHRDGLAPATSRSATRSSSETRHPRSRTRPAGRRPAGQMTPRRGVIEGAGSQVGTGSRWGDYSSMSSTRTGARSGSRGVLPRHGQFGWNTRIGSFSLPRCGDPQLSMSASSSEVQLRNDLTYTIAVNSGQNAALGATVTDVLPSGVTLLSASTTRGTCQGTTTVLATSATFPREIWRRSRSRSTRVARATSRTAQRCPLRARTVSVNNTKRHDAGLQPVCRAGSGQATDPSGDATAPCRSRTSRPWRSPSRTSRRTRTSSCSR